MDNSNNLPTRDIALDIAKGIGIMMVVCSHVGINELFFQFFYAFYIPLFFVCSGCTTPFDFDTARLSRRLKKLLSAYFGISAVLFLIAMLNNAVSHAEDNFSYAADALKGICYSRYCLSESLPHLMNVCNAPLWYLTAYAVVLVLYYAYGKLPAAWRAGIALPLFSTILCLGISCAFSATPILLPWSIDTAFMGLIFLVSGMYFKRHNVIQRLSFPILLLLLGSFLGLFFYNPGIIISIRHYGEHGYLSVLFFMLIGCIGSLLTIKGSALIQRYFQTAGTLLSFVGKHTLCILGFHILCLKILYLGEGKALGHLDEPYTALIKIANVVLAVGICCCIGCAWARLSPRHKRKQAAAPHETQ